MDGSPDLFYEVRREVGRPTFYTRRLLWLFCCCVRADEVLDVDAQRRLVVAVGSAGVERRRGVGVSVRRKGGREGGREGGSEGGGRRRGEW
jgi:hypothetical protein